MPRNDKNGNIKKAEAQRLNLGLLHTFMLSALEFIYAVVNYSAVFRCLRACENAVGRIFYERVYVAGNVF